jgi:hypothetical protein
MYFLPIKSNCYLYYFLPIKSNCYLYYFSMRVNAEKNAGKKAGKKWKKKRETVGKYFVTIGNFFFSSLFLFIFFITNPINFVSHEFLKVERNRLFPSLSTCFSVAYFHSRVFSQSRNLYRYISM